MAFQANRLYRQTVWVQAKHNSENDGFLFEETISIFSKTKVIFSVYQHDYQFFTIDRPTRIFRHYRYVDYKIYAWENLDNIVREYTGSKVLTQRVYFAYHSRKVYTNLILRNRFNEIPQYDNYELDIRIVISEPFNNVCSSRFLLA